MIHQTRFLFKLFITYFTRQQCIDQTQPFNPDFFSKCSSHTLQDNNVVTKHNPANQIFQNWGHACSRDDKSKIGNTRVREQACYEQVLQALKKAGSSLKFYTDENGQIYFRTKDNGPKHKITYFTESRHGNPITLLNKDEIVAKIEKCQWTCLIVTFATRITSK